MQQTLTTAGLHYVAANEIGTALAEFDGATSVGAVCWPYYMKTRKTDPARFLLDTIALSPALAERLRDARLVSEVTATGNYSYHSERMYGDRHIMLGDAFAFVDPVFSSGVMLAMNSAFLGAEAVDDAGQLHRTRAARAWPRGEEPEPTATRAPLRACPPKPSLWPSGEGEHFRSRGPRCTQTARR